LIVADEPTSALDVVVQRRVAQTLLQVKERSGAAILVVGHDVALLAQLVDRLAVMRRGNIVELGQTKTLLREPLHPYTQLLISSVPSFKHRKSAIDRVSAGSRDGESHQAPARFATTPSGSHSGRLREVAPGHFVAADEHV